MTQPPDDTPDFLAKPVPPSGEQPHDPAPPTYGEPTSPYVSPPQPAYGQAPPGPGYPAYSPYGAAPGTGGGYPFAQAHSGANVAMGLGITSLVCALGTFVVCITLPGVLTGPFAIVLAVRARKEMRQNPGLYNNEGSAMAGLITGIIGTVLGLVIIAAGLFFVTALFSMGT